MSYFGGLMVAGSATLMLLSALLELSLAKPSPYIGIVTYLLLPAGVFLGILVFLYGMRRESLRRRKLARSEALPYPRLDLNEPRQRRKFGWFLAGSALLFVALAFAAYNGFRFTESVTFCGQVCHTPMEPEYTTYKSSSHARVPCVDCHVGSGATWYVKSKLSGVRQVFAVLFDNYQKPIPVPLHNLRPARETCEHCHWPEKFYGARLVQIPHFRFDERNTGEQIGLLLKTGGGRPELGRSAGIHWHMAIENQVSFVALDPGLQHIATIRVKRSDGTTTEYLSRDLKLPAKGAQPERLMDCMDCHNRPSHRIEPPEDAMNRALAAGLISPRLPWVKRLGVDALVQTYPDRAAAREGIRGHIAGFYKAKYPRVLAESAADVEKAIQAVIAIHERNVFPAMKVGFNTYPSNIGHRSWPGCFRCHDGRHATKDGKVLSMDCTACHTAPERGPLTPLGVTAPPRAKHWHPFELKGKHADLLCHQCHAAGANPGSTCSTCHAVAQDSEKMKSMTCGACHFEDATGKRPGCTSGGCHEGLAGLHKTRGHDVSCVRCHTPHTWRVSSPAVCRSCHSGPNPPAAAPGAWSR